MGVEKIFVGFSMVVRGRVSPIFYVTGLIVTGFVVIWATWIHELAVPHTPDEAVTQTAKGINERTQGQLTRAIRSFDRAIALDQQPAFGQFLDAHGPFSFLVFLPGVPAWRSCRAFLRSARQTRE